MAKKTKKKTKKGGKKKGGTKGGGGGGQAAPAAPEVHFLYDGVAVTPLEPMAIPAVSDSAADGLSQGVNARQSEMPFGIVTLPGDAVGRRAVANRALEAGVQLVRERAVCWAPYAREARAVCLTCAATGGRMQVCGGCQGAAYCSDQCRAADAERHGQLCAVFKALPALAAEHQVDVDLGRMAAVCVHASGVDPQRRVGTVPRGTYPSTFADMLAMMSHAENKLPEEVQQLTAKFARCLTALMGVEETVEPDAVIGYMLRVNSNAHGLFTERGEISKSFGYGLFPLCAIFNHSCYPNTIYVNDGHHLIFRTVRPVQKGEELCVNYEGLYQTTLRRQRELLMSKKFLCHCRRCVRRPATEEELAMVMHDRFLDAIVCPQPKCKGYVLRGQTATEAEEKKGGGKEGEGEEVTERNLGWFCAQCQQPMSDAAHAEAVKRLEELLAAAAKEAARCKPSAQMDAYERALRELRRHVHPHHEMVHGTLTTLINLYNACGELKKSLHETRVLIEMSECVYPRHMLLLLPYYRSLQQTLGKYLNGQRALPKLLQKQYEELLAAAKLRVDEIMAVSCGI